MFKTITTFVASFALLAVGSVSAQSHVDFRDTLRMTFPATVSYQELATTTMQTNSVNCASSIAWVIVRWRWN